MASPNTDQPAAKCPVVMSSGEPCGRKPYDDKGLCICHSESSDKDLDAFDWEIEALLARKDYDFTRFVFPADEDFSGTAFDAPTCFRWATFHDHVDFRAATFQHAADFFRATFQRDATFFLATFQGEALFALTTFQGKALFAMATFENNAGFAETTFQGEADFAEATFDNVAAFAETTFEGNADFVEAVFHNVAEFRKATFKGNVGFAEPTFHGEADFVGAVFQGHARFVGISDECVFSREADADFRLARFEQPERVVFHHVLLGRARFLGTDVRKVDFTDVEWARRSPRGRFAAWDEVAPGEGKDYALIGKLYRQLKHNYEEQRDPIAAGDFHFGEMHMRRLSNPPRNRAVRFLKRNLSFLALYRWVSGYGEDYLLPLVWIVGVILVFAGLTYLPPFALQTDPSSAATQPVQGFLPRLLYSVMCFLLRGDKPIQPAYLAGHYLAVAEGIMGPPLIALFVLALNRRFKR